MPEMSLDDLSSLYKHSVVLMNNKPVYVEAFNQRCEVLVFDLLSQRHKTVSYTSSLFKAPTRRIGFVNINESVVYVYRNPLRRYKIGYSDENIKVCTIDVPYPLNRSITRDRVEKLKAIEIADAMNNRYPSLTQAWLNSLRFNGACAFDKQFAVSYDGVVFYKTSRVGFADRVDGRMYVRFTEEHEHLKLLLGELS